MSVSVVMPCYNEEGIIEQSVRDIYNEIISKVDDSELIVVDDCSNDRTPVILGGLKKEFPNLRILRPSVNGGHGKAIQMGYKAVEKKWVFQVDSDNQFDIKDFWSLYAARDVADFIVGVRKVRQDPSYRLMLTRVIRFVNFVLFGIWLNDANCPFRLIKRDIHDELLKSIDADVLAPNIMVTILARKRKIKIIEIPITHYRRKTGNNSIVSWKLIKFCAKGFRQLLGFRKVSILSHYK